jgi:hypothetical protein
MDLNVFLDYYISSETLGGDYAALRFKVAADTFLEDFSSSTLEEMFLDFNPSFLFI